MFRAGETYAFAPDIGEAEPSRSSPRAMKEARARGFRAMQYNLVVCANEGAIRLWKKHGFAVIGVLPGAFRHARLGYVDALVMYKPLVD